MNRHITQEHRVRFMLLLEPLLPGLLRTAQRMTGDRHAAEDLIQAASLKALRFFGTWSEGTNFKAWFYRVLYTTHVNHLRDREPLSQTLLEESEAVSSAESLLQELNRPTHAERAAAVLESVDDEIRAAVDALPAHLRIVFLLSTLENLKYREIAGILDCPIGTVMSRLFRARELLHQRLARHARSLGWQVTDSPQKEPAP